MDRPRLEKGLDSKTFRSFYYLKEELVDFCRKNELPVSGSKSELTEKIAVFLDTGKVVASTRIAQKGTQDAQHLLVKRRMEEFFGAEILTGIMLYRLLCILLQRTDMLPYLPVILLILLAMRVVCQKELQTPFLQWQPIMFQWMG